MEVVNINENFMMAAPFLKLKYKCETVIPSVIITGNKAGYNLKLDMKSPFNISMKERCIPQPGQSIPDTCL